MDREPIKTAQLILQSIHTQALGRALGEYIRAGQIIALQGDLGAGKTTFTQGLAEGMDIDDHVTSPTFTLVNEYGSDRPVRLVHVDTYRLDEMPDYAIMEAATFGLEDILDRENLVDASGNGAVVVIEWAERIAPLLPPDHLLMRISQTSDPNLRDVECTAFGANSIELLHHAAETLTS